MTWYNADENAQQYGAREVDRIGGGIVPHYKPRYCEILVGIVAGRVSHAITQRMIVMVTDVDN